MDLRFVLAMLKINSDLERIGDYAYSIARFVKETDAEKLDAALVDRLQLERMFDIVLEMMNGLQSSLMDENPSKASSVIDMDDELDRSRPLPTASWWSTPEQRTSFRWSWDSAASSASSSAPATI